jgi:hypothetical protein
MAVNSLNAEGDRSLFKSTKGDIGYLSPCPKCLRHKKLSISKQEIIIVACFLASINGIPSNICHFSFRDPNLLSIILRRLA